MQRDSMKSVFNGTPWYLRPAKVAIILNITNAGSTEDCGAGARDGQCHHLDDFV